MINRKKENVTRNCSPSGLHLQPCVSSCTPHIATPHQKIQPERIVLVGPVSSAAIVIYESKRLKRVVPARLCLQETAWNLTFLNHRQRRTCAAELVLREEAERACHLLSSLLQHQPKLLHNLQAVTIVILEREFLIDLVLSNSSLILCFLLHK